MNRKNLLTIGSLLVVVCLTALSAKADPKFEFDGLLAQLERQDSGLHLALGNLQNHNPSSTTAAFLGKRSGLSEISGLTFSVPSPDDCRLDSLRPCSQHETPTSAPEPATMLLLGTGLAGVAGLIRRQRRIRRSSRNE